MSIASIHQFLRGFRGLSRARPKDDDRRRAANRLAASDELQLPRQLGPVREAGAEGIHLSGVMLMRRAAYVGTGPNC